MCEKDIKLINNLIESDLLESGCSEETANEYKDALKYILYEAKRNIEILNNYGIFTKSQIEYVINNSVSDYDCLIERLYEMIYPEIYKNEE